MTSATWPHQRENTFTVDYESDADTYVDQATTAARDRSFGLFGDKIAREGAALVIVADLHSYDATWCGEVALRLLRQGRHDDAAMWTRAGSMMDEATRNVRQ